MLEEWKYFSNHNFRAWWPTFAKFVVMFINFFILTVFESLWVGILPFHCGSAVCVIHEWSLLCFVIQLFRGLFDGVYITSKCSKFMDDRLFPIPCKVRWDVVCITFYSAYMNLWWCFCYTVSFIFMLITINKTWSYHIMDASVVSFILSIDPGRISTSSFHVYSEFINK